MAEHRIVNAFDDILSVSSKLVIESFHLIMVCVCVCVCVRACVRVRECVGRANGKLNKHEPQMCKRSAFFSGIAMDSRYVTE